LASEEFPSSHLLIFYTPIENEQNVIILNIISLNFVLNFFFPYFTFFIFFNTFELKYFLSIQYNLGFLYSKLVTSKWGPLYTRSGALFKKEGKNGTKSKLAQK